MSKTILVDLKGRVGVGIHANTEEFLKCLELMYQANDDDVIDINVQNIDFIYPSGIIILYLSGLYLFKERRCKIKQNEATKSEVNNFLAHSGFFNCVGQPQITERLVKHIYSCKNTCI